MAWLVRQGLATDPNSDNRHHNQAEEGMMLVVMQRHAYSTGDTDLAQLLLESTEVLLSSDMLIEQRVELGTRQQVLALQHGNDNIIRQRVIGWWRVCAANLQCAGGVWPASVNHGA